VSTTSTFVIQYLEDSPRVPGLSPHAIAEKLRSAFERLPIHAVLLGWKLSDAQIDICAAECARAGAALYRWHPLLSGDGVLVPRPNWKTIGLNGAPVPGFGGMPEFTFMCPNRPAVQEATLGRVRDALADGRYQGLFLDRMRFPSPAADPERALACFCEDCQRVAAQEGLDLAALQAHITGCLAAAGRPDHLRSFIRALLDPACEAECEALRALLAFRERTITRFVGGMAQVIREAGLHVGLDCFSPSLTRMVGQDLVALREGSAWVKIMSYAHTLGPAGLPFELLGLADWLMDRHGVPEADALRWIGEATRLPVPATRAALRDQGLPPAALCAEARRGAVVRPTVLLAGIELVEIPGIAHLDDAQIRADVAALREGQTDGLALSWDLWEMPLERLDIVRAAWG
jgi:hypothetical protein